MLSLNSGASFIGFMFIFITFSKLSPNSLVIFTFILSFPLKFAFGVIVYLPELSRVILEFLGLLINSNLTSPPILLT